MAPPVYGSTDALLADVIERAARAIEELVREKELDGVNEARHLQPTMEVAAREVANAAAGSLEVRPQLTVRNACWPRLGAVDIALLPIDAEPIWVELKCGAGCNALGPCVWDVVKCAWGLARGDAGVTYLVGGTTADDWANSIRGAGFFAAETWCTWELRDSFADWWRLWERQGYPAATCLPERFATQAISTASFYVGESPWELRLARVSMAEGVAWLEWPSLLGGGGI